MGEAQDTPGGMSVTSDQKITLYGVARAALRRHREDQGIGGVEGETIAVQKALAWVLPILVIDPDPELVGFIVQDVVSNGGDIPEASLDNLIDHVRTLEEAHEANTKVIADQDELLDKLLERLGAIVGSSITNDNGVQVTIVVPKGVWTSLRRLLDPAADDEE